MKKVFFTAGLLLTLMTATAQKEKYAILAVYNTHSSYPFGRFAGIFTEIVHPGIEVGYGTNFRMRKKYGWFWDVRAGYFYHRFVQHGIPLYANLGYRYKINRWFSADLALGAGYLHSFPDADIFTLNDGGEYVPKKHTGRMQGMGSLGISVGYLLQPHNPGSIKLFITYQTRIQFPFVKSYVPLLPYNSIMLGLNKPIYNK